MSTKPVTFCEECVWRQSVAVTFGRPFIACPVCLAAINNRRNQRRKARRS